MKYADFDLPEKKTLDPAIIASIIGGIALIFSVVIGNPTHSDGYREDCSSLRTEILQQAELNPKALDVQYGSQTEEQLQCNINQFLDSVSKEKDAPE